MGKSSIVLWKDIHEIAQKVCKHYGLSYGKIVPETRKLAQHYGEIQSCDKCLNSEYIDEVNCSEKILYIRIHQLDRPRVPLAESTIFHTLAHELAHLRHWKHGTEHRGFQEEIMELMREMGYKI